MKMIMKRFVANRIFQMIGDGKNITNKDSIQDNRNEILDKRNTAEEFCFIVNQYTHKSVVIFIIDSGLALELFYDFALRNHELMILFCVFILFFLHLFTYFSPSCFHLSIFHSFFIYLSLSSFSSFPSSPSFFLGLLLFLIFRKFLFVSLFSPDLFNLFMYLLIYLCIYISICLPIY